MLHQIFTTPRVDKAGNKMTTGSPRIAGSPKLRIFEVKFSLNYFKLRLKSVLTSKLPKMAHKLRDFKENFDAP